MKISRQQYEYALERVEELLPMVAEDASPYDKVVVELTIVSDMVREYEKEYFPIEKPTIGELIKLSIEEQGMSQRQLAGEIGVSPSRINDYISGRAEPTLKVARSLCSVLGIAPAAMLGM